MRPWQIAACIPAVMLVGILPAHAQDGPVLPEGARTITDDEGRFVRCLAPASMGDTAQFETTCKQWLEANRRVRIARPADKKDWITPDDYPAAARETGARGRVTIRVSIAADAKVTKCEVIQSSGNAALDDAACDATLRKARFHARLDRDGKPVASDYTRNVTW